MNKIHRKLKQQQRPLALFVRIQFVRLNKEKPATTENDSILRKAPDMLRRTPLPKAKKEKSKKKKLSQRSLYEEGKATTVTKEKSKLKD